MRGWRLAVVVLAGLAAAVVTTVVAVAVNALTSGPSGWYRLIERHPLWWSAAATAAAGGLALLVWRVQAWYDRESAELVPAVERPEAWVVDRPAEVNQVVAALCRTSGGTVGVTTAVQGAGGFGKTTVAKMVRADRRVMRRFRGRVYWVTLGRDAGKEALAGLVNGLIARLEPERPVTFTDARQAGEHLAAMMAKGPRRLLILDDVWSEEQLAVFPAAGRCARLVTTRIPSLTAGMALPVRVDQMSSAQARALLVADLPPLPSAVVARLLDETGRWPLLLRLVNKLLAGQAGLHLDVTAAAEELLGLLRAGGRASVDELTGAAGQPLDVTDPVQRQQAVWATIQASTGLLGATECSRLAELAVFAEDETIPIPLIAALWSATGGLDSIAAGALCARLTDLALLAPSPGGGMVTMHDVIRDYHRDELGADRLAQLHEILLSIIAETLPTATPVAGAGSVTAWWELPKDARYLRDHLIDHMLAARRAGQAEETAADLRWVGARLQASGPAGAYADLALVGTSRAERLAWVLGQVAHLLAPTDPPYSVADILYCRIGHDPDWGPQAMTLTASRAVPALASAWPPPDLPAPPLRRVIVGHTESVTAVAVAPDGTWIATGSWDKTGRIWNPVTGRQRAVLTGHNDAVTAVAIASDGLWLVTASDDGSVWIWDSNTGQLRAKAINSKIAISAIAIAPDGTWLATGHKDGPVRIWDAETGRQRAVLVGHDHAVTAVAIAPDGTWLATAGDDTARIWDTETGQERAVLAGHRWLVAGVAIAPDGTWLATASWDRTAGIWDARTGRRRAWLTGHNRAVTAVAIAPDGTWLATVGDDTTARIWDAETGQERTALAGHNDQMTAVAIAPDGTWLATASSDDTVRIWDPAIDRQQHAALTGHVIGQRAVAFAPDGTWLATASGEKRIWIWDVDTSRHHDIRTSDSWVSAIAVAPDGTWVATVGSNEPIVIWDMATGERRARLTGDKRQIDALAVAPDGTWLVAGGYDGPVQIWDVATGRERGNLNGYRDSVCAIAVAPDGTWLATGSYDGSVRTWEVTTGQQLAALTGHRGAVHAIAVAPDGTWLATAGLDEPARIWDAATGRQRTVLGGHTEPVDAVAIAPDGAWLATASHDQTLRIWELATSKVRAVMRVDSPLYGCAWNRHGTLLAAVGDAGLYLFSFHFDRR